VPTARELLDQADALMRRNRASSEDDIPLLTDAVPSAQEAQSRFAPVRRPAAAPAGAAGLGDDVPLLTDEVEEIEAAAIDAEVGEGEPSAWLDFEEAEPSVIGDAPDSIAIVPPVDLRRPAPAPDPDEFEDTGELDAIDEDLAAAIAAAPREEESMRPPAAAEPPAVEPRPEPAEISSRTPAVIAGGAAALLTGAALPVAQAAAAPDAVIPMAIPPEAAVPEPPMPALPEPPAPRDDAAHWEAVAEEIRMQVLQRIDLFTDTGLRVQLGERLQPIVDRASADLVATINQHVGELLRAYVAEAIEREIESWRKNH
jgi:hypothetical protein